MKPKDLKKPFAFKERCVLIQDKILFVPEYYKEYAAFQFPSWEEIFGNDKPVEVEYCSGNGEWIINRALFHPESNWVAIEKKFDRVRKIWSKMKNKNLTNLFIVGGEGYTTTKFYFPSDSIETVFINFPDPWPKKRHSKHRIIKDAFLDELHRILKKQGKLMIVTDDQGYLNDIIQIIGENQKFTFESPPPFFKTELDSYGSSYFERIWRDQGKEIYYISCSKSLEAPVSS